MTDHPHEHYIKAVADAIEAAGLTITDWQGSDNGERLEAWIELSPNTDGDALTLAWCSENGWEYGWTDTSDRHQGIQELGTLCGVAEPPAVVVATLLHEVVELRILLREEVPDDLESALAAYAPTVEPEPDPADPRVIAEQLMLGAARSPSRHAVWGAIDEARPGITSYARHAERNGLLQTIYELAATADITIGWREEGR